MRRITALFTAAILLLCIALPFICTQAESDYSIVRVKLSIGDSENKKTIKLKGQYFIEETAAFITDGELIISNNKDSGALSILHKQNNSSTPVSIFEGSTKCTILRCSSDINAGYFSLFNTNHNLTLNYLGDLTIHSYKSSSGYYLRLINTVSMLEYLYGVVPNEMPESSPIEALKSQAIASKGFAIYMIGLASKSSIYDLRDTSQDQVYEGYKPALIKSIAAVDETINEALYLNNKLFPTFYGHSNGGETVTPKQAWGNNTFYDAAYQQTLDPYDLENPDSHVEVAFFPAKNTSEYLTSVNTPKNDGYWYSSYSKINSFLLMYTRQALVSAGAADLNAQVTKINEIFTMYSMPDEGEESTISHTYAHIALNASVTTANLISKQNTITLSEPIKLNPLIVKNAFEKETYETKAETTDITFTFSFKMSELYALNVMTRNSLRIYNVQEVDDGFAVYHRRFGHGVGLSQSSAQVMAGEKYNMDYKEILNYFFPGASLDEISFNEKPPFVSPTPVPTPSNSHYIIDDKTMTISGLSPASSPFEFFELLGGGQLTAFGSNNGNFIGTNSSVLLNGKEYTVILYGDTNGDGLINIADATAVLHHVVGIKTLDKAYLKAADADASGNINVYDSTLISHCIVGSDTIEQIR